MKLNDVNNIFKVVLVYLLASSVFVMAWFGKINSETFTGFVSAALMWYLNSRKIENLQSENKELNDKITVLSAEKIKIIQENQIEQQG